MHTWIHLTSSIHSGTAAENKAPCSGHDVSVHFLTERETKVCTGYNPHTVGQQAAKGSLTCKTTWLFFLQPVFVPLSVSCKFKKQSCLTAGLQSINVYSSIKSRDKCPFRAITYCEPLLEANTLTIGNQADLGVQHETEFRV
ncbi:UNVERIFIED_CONTAM: hypothetical protein K2H54_058169 [Gekko kuhli]